MSYPSPPPHSSHTLALRSGPRPPLLLVQRKDPSFAGAGAMGRRKFRLSAMIPNYWFHKLRDMRRAHRHRGGGGGGGSAMLPSSSSSSPRGPRGGPKPATPRRASVALAHRPSYYYTTRDRLPPPSPSPAQQPRATEEDQLLPLPQSPPRSSMRRHRVGPVRVGRVLEPVAEPPDAAQRRRDMHICGKDASEFRKPTATTTPDGALGGKVIASDTDIIIDLLAEDMSERMLRPIVTRPARRDDRKETEIDRCELKKEAHVDHAAMTPRASCATEQGSKGNPRRSSVSTGRRLKTRANSPRLASTRSGKVKSAKTPAPSPRKKTSPPPLAESFAVVKASADPRKDFRESMEEMIAEKGIRDATDLEDLLACYLALNAAEYHDLIVEVFEQIWTGLAGVSEP
ncbi:hypothetical protein ACP70R_035559 [Stipagrostis hirtigluma subsp. patula]